MAKKKKPKKRPNGGSGKVDGGGGESDADNDNPKDAAPDPPPAPRLVGASGGEDDLSLRRRDEATVLSAIYGDDFSSCTGAWGCPLYMIRAHSPDDHDDDDDARC
jgi:hypothetical protein